MRASRGSVAGFMETPAITFRRATTARATGVGKLKAVRIDPSMRARTRNTGLEGLEVNVARTREHETKQQLVDEADQLGIANDSLERGPASARILSRLRFTSATAASE